MLLNYIIFGTANKAAANLLWDEHVDSLMYVNVSHLNLQKVVVFVVVVVVVVVKAKNMEFNSDLQPLFPILRRTHPGSDFCWRRPFLTLCCHFVG